MLESNKSMLVKVTPGMKQVHDYLSNMLLIRRSEYIKIPESWENAETVGIACLNFLLEISINKWWLRCNFSYAKTQIWNYIDGSVQDFSNSIANALELLQSCTKPSIY